MRCIKIMKRSKLSDEEGAVFILVACLLVVFVAFTAMAIDIAHLYVVRNELHNAADAGALAGARFLYKADGTVNDAANLIAKTAAMENDSERVQVEVNWTSGNTGDVERGHWRFSDRTFHPYDVLTAPTLWNRSNEELDNDLTFVNAVRVKTRRETTKADSFFAGFLGFMGFDVSARSVAYIGFAGSLLPLDVDLPIALCEESLLKDDKYDCSIGRMLNSSDDPNTSDTGAWTDFNQVGDVCKGGTNADTMKTLIDKCPSPENTTILTLGKNIALTNGVADSVFGKIHMVKGLYDCWQTVTEKKRLWQRTLPVISCPDNKVGPTCGKIVGAVTVNLVWINSTSDPLYKNAPTEMAGGAGYTDWSSSDPDGAVRWDSFRKHFHLKNVDGISDADYMDKSIYFLPECTPHKPIGNTGGLNFNILAEIPVLVH
jgi:hypothetical protein